MKLMPASNAASTQARACVVADAAAVGQPRAEADLRDLEVAVAELPVAQGKDRCRSGTRAVGAGGYRARPWRSRQPSSTSAASADVSGRWLGRCPGCGEFGTLVAEARLSRARAAHRERRRARVPLRLVDVVAEEAERHPDRRPGARPRARRRARAGVARARRRRARRRQVDAAALGARRDLARPPRAAVTGEESVAQVKLRAARLGGCDEVEILAETELDVVCETLERERPAVCVIDSVQTLWSAEIGSAPGLGLPGARGRRRDCCASRRRPASRRSSSATSRRTARLQARACSSISSTACCSSRATATTPIASCGPSRTGSARRTSSASSR